MARPKTANAVIVKECSNDVLKAANLEESPIPALQSGEILVKMLAAPINPSDRLSITGRYGVKFTCPFVVGFEGVGEIVEVGNGVKTVANGDWIIPKRTDLGTWRDYGVFKADQVVKVDKSMGWKAAATMIVNPTTAYFLLTDIIKLEPGQTVIQNGANSMVGKILIQIAKSKGIKTINVVRKRANLKELVDELKGLGADHVVTDEDLKTTKFEETPALAIDCVGGAATALLMSHLADGGTLVNYGALSGQALQVDPLNLIFRDLKVCSFWLNRAMQTGGSRLQNEVAPYLGKLAALGKFKLPEFEMVLLKDFKKGIEKSSEAFANKKQMLIMDPSLMD